MKLPDPSNFPRTSPSARLEESALDGRILPAPVDLRLIFDLPPVRERRPDRRPSPPASTFPASWQAATEEKKIFLPMMANGRPVVRRTKSGELQTVKFPVLIVTRTVTATLEHGTFTLTATSRGSNVADSRDGSRRPIAYFRADLRKLFAAGADAIADTLAEVMPPPRQPKARKISPLDDAARAKAAVAITDRAQAEKELADKRRQPAVPPKKEPDFAAMSPRKFAAYNARKLAESREEMGWLDIDTALAGGDRPEIIPARTFPAPFIA